MTTTPETRTPEQVIHRALHDHKGRPYPVNENTAAYVADELRAAGLIGVDPTEEQIERALDALSRFNEWTDNPRGAMRAALSAAGVALQEPSPVASAPTVGDDGGHGGNDDRGGREDGPEDEGCSHRSTVAVTEGWSPDREKLASRLRGDILDAVPDNNDMQHILEMAAAALAAQPVLDPEKVAEAINTALDAWESEERSEIFVARALCEAAKRGELNAD